jgi:hypothetical protein
LKSYAVFFIPRTCWVRFWSNQVARGREAGERKGERACNDALPADARAMTRRPCFALCSWGSCFVLALRQRRRDVLRRSLCCFRREFSRSRCRCERQRCARATCSAVGQITGPAAAAGSASGAGVSADSAAGDGKFVTANLPRRLCAETWTGRRCAPARREAQRR